MSDASFHWLGLVMFMVKVLTVPLFVSLQGTRVLAMASRTLSRQTEQALTWATILF